MDTIYAWLPDSLDMRAFAMLATGAGVIYCLVGYILLRGAIALAGFAVAASVAATFACWFNAGDTLTVAALALAGGICGAFALTFLYKAGVFCVGLLAAALIAHALLAGRPEPWAPWAIWGGAAAGGGIALLIERPIMVLATAALGAWVASSSLAALIMGRETSMLEGGLALSGRESWIMLTTWAILSIIGAATQFALSKPRNKND